MDTYILGGGITGLAAGISSGRPIFEAAVQPGGICSSYYMRPGTTERLAQAPLDEEAYRFELGGGHWIFGGDSTILHFLRTLTPLKSYQRRSAVYFAERNCYVPYPLQNHLRYLGSATVRQVLSELVGHPGAIQTMAEWLTESFGPTLCTLFFNPFHERYTAGLHRKIAPQDAYKSPVNLPHVIQGAFEDAPPVGYNVSFVYPAAGLNCLIQRMADACEIYYDRQAVAIDLTKRVISFSNGSTVGYHTLLSTLPLNQMMRLADLQTTAPADPYTSVLVLNIGARRGEQCPADHWLYTPDAKAGFHRVGFYSNVDHAFLPATTRPTNQNVSIYVERAYSGSNKPSAAEIQAYTVAVITELQTWGYITDVDVVDPTWIEVAYTWTYPHSRWRQEALQQLEAHGVYQIGRYGRWVFQGIADSVRDGFYAGASFKRI